MILEYDGAENEGVLRWTPNPRGHRPVAYRIYASDEKGFSARDEPYRVTTGITKELPTLFPANFVMETQATEMRVLGPLVALAGMNRAFYRVVAVDEAGRRSGASDYAEAPRPVVFSQPLLKAKAGVEYVTAFSVVRSLGDLRTRVIEGRETMNFWDIERPRFQLERGPGWLKIDEATGQLHGKPAAAGSAEVIVAITLERPVRSLHEDDLEWGRERVVSSGTELVGKSTQRFVIDVAP